MERGARAVRELGPVLGAYHPVVADNVRRLRGDLRARRGVVPHVRHRGRDAGGAACALSHAAASHLVRFCGAYHGWWGDVQPGVGNPLPAHETYTLKDMSENTLRVLRTRRDIACVLVNPLQALHPNATRRAIPRWSTAATKRRFRHARPIRHWLQALRAVCTERGIVLIFDEVFVGFRLAPRRRAGILRRAADLVTYGKTLGGGLPVGVVCGRQDLMKRFRDDRPADICFARGTFNSHPYVMGAMHEFLQHLETPEVSALYQRPRRAPGTAGRARSTRGCARRACRSQSPTCRRSGPSATRSRRATTGCCNITCAPKAWR